MSESGEVLLSEHRDPATGRIRVRIEKADPRARIAPELLDRISEGSCAPWASISGDQLDVITLADDYGQRFVYRLGNYDHLTDTFDMEWPD